MTSEPRPSLLPGLDLNRMLGLLGRAAQGPEQAIGVWREFLGLETESRERAVDLVAQTARAWNVDASPLFEGLLRFGPLPTARVAAAAYLAEQGREDVVVEALEGLEPPMLTLTLITGLLDVLATRAATPERVARLLAWAERFDEQRHYTTPYLGDFTGVDVRRLVRRTLAESLLRRDAPGAAGWPSAYP